MSDVHILLSLKLHRLEVWECGISKNICVCYENSEIKDGSMLRSTWGEGSNFECACSDYLRKIRGKTLVFNACTKNREEITVLG